MPRSLRPTLSSGVRKCIKVPTKNMSTRYICPGSGASAVASLSHLPAKPEKFAEMEEEGLIRPAPRQVLRGMDEVRLKKPISMHMKVGQEAKSKVPDSMHFEDPEEAVSKSFDIVVDVLHKSLLGGKRGYVSENTKVTEGLKDLPAGVGIPEKGRIGSAGEFLSRLLTPSPSGGVRALIDQKTGKVTLDQPTPYKTASISAGPARDRAWAFAQEKGRAATKRQELGEKAEDWAASTQGLSHFPSRLKLPADSPERLSAIIDMATMVIPIPGAKALQIGGKAFLKTLTRGARAAVSKAKNIGEVAKILGGEVVSTAGRVRIHVDPYKIHEFSSVLPQSLKLELKSKAAESLTSKLSKVGKVKVPSYEPPASLSHAGTQLETKLEPSSTVELKHKFKPTRGAKLEYGEGSKIGTELKHEFKTPEKAELKTSTKENFKPTSQSRPAPKAPPNAGTGVRFSLGILPKKDVEAPTPTPKRVVGSHTKESVALPETTKDVVRPISTLTTPSKRSSREGTEGLRLLSGANAAGGKGGSSSRKPIEVYGVSSKQGKEPSSKARGESMKEGREVEDRYLTIRREVKAKDIRKNPEDMYKGGTLVFLYGNRVLHNQMSLKDALDKVPSWRQDDLLEYLRRNRDKKHGG